MKEVSECFKIGYLQPQQIQNKFWPHTHSLQFTSPHSKILQGYATVVPLYSSAPLHLCVVSRVCILLGSFCNLCLKMYGNLFSGRPSKVLPWSWQKSLIYIIFVCLLDGVWHVGLPHTMKPISGRRCHSFRRHHLKTIAVIRVVQSPKAAVSHSKKPIL